MDLLDISAFEVVVGDEYSGISSIEIPFERASGVDEVCVDAIVEDNEIGIGCSAKDAVEDGIP